MSIAIVLIGCQPSETAPFNAAAQNAVKQEVKFMLHDYHQAMNNEGLLSEVRFLDSTEAFFWVPPGYESWISYDSVMTVLRATDPTIGSMNLVWTTLRVDPLSPTLASFTGRIHNVIVDTTGTKNEFDLLETGIAIKRKDGWKLLSGQSRIAE